MQFKDSIHHSWISSLCNIYDTITEGSNVVNVVDTYHAGKFHRYELKWIFGIKRAFYEWAYSIHHFGITLNIGYQNADNCLHGEIMTSSYVSKIQKEYILFA